MSSNFTNRMQNKFFVIAIISVLVVVIKFWLFDVSDEESEVNKIPDGNSEVAASKSKLNAKIDERIIEKQPEDLLAVKCNYDFINEKIQSFAHGYDVTHSAKVETGLPIPSNLSELIFEFAPYDQRIAQKIINSALSGKFDEINKIVESSNVTPEDAMTLIYEVVEDPEDIPQSQLSYEFINLAAHHVVSLLKSTISEDILFNLVSSSDSTWHHFWYEEEQLTTFPYLAIKNKKFALAQYWLEQGIPAYIPGKTDGIYSLIIENLNNEHEEEAIALIEYLHDIRNVPFTEAEYNSVQNWAFSLNESDNSERLRKGVMSSFDNDKIDLMDEFIAENEKCLTQFFKQIDSKELSVESEDVIFEKIIMYAVNSKQFQATAEPSFNVDLNPFYADNSVQLNAILVALKNDDIETAFSIVASQFQRAEDEHKAKGFIAENAILMKLSNEKLNKIKNYGGHLSAEFILSALKINDPDIMVTLDNFIPVWDQDVLDSITEEKEISMAAVHFLGEKGIKFE